MSDPSVTLRDPAPNDSAGNGIPDWSTFARQHEWRRAQAAASLNHADPALQAAITALSAFQEDVRAKRYPSARRALAGYNSGLAELRPQSPGDAALLVALAAPESLEAALEALETSSKEVDLDQINQKLAPAFLHVLTKAEALNTMGVLLALQEHTERAKEHFNDALQSDQGHYRARMNLGNLALEAGDAAHAESQYREVLKLAPEYDGAHHNLGVALRRQGKLQASVSSIRRAQKLGMRRTQQDAKEEMQEQLRANPKLRMIRTAVFVVGALIVFLLFWQGRGH